MTLLKDILITEDDSWSPTAELKKIIAGLKQAVKDIRSVDKKITMNKPKNTGNDTTDAGNKNRFKSREMSRHEDILRLEETIRKLEQSMSGTAYTYMKR